jgi:hypothetical protein
MSTIPATRMTLLAARLRGGREGVINGLSDTLAFEPYQLDYSTPHGFDDPEVQDAYGTGYSVGYAEGFYNGVLALDCWNDQLAASFLDFEDDC